MQKGKTNNPNGRPVGSKNQKTKEWEALGESILTRHASRFNNILNSSKDGEFMDKFLSIIEYFQPKLARVESKQQVESETVIRFEFNDSYTPEAPPETGGISEGEKKV